MCSWGYGTDAKRKSMMDKDSFEMELVGPLFLDFFRQKEYLFPLVDVHIRLTRNDPKFYLRTESGTLPWSVSIEKAILKVKKVQMNSEIYHNHSQGLLKQPVLYPIQRSIMMKQTIPAGSTDYRYELPEMSPKLIITALVDSEISFAKNPFYFDHFKLNRFIVTTNGKMKIFEPDFENKLCVNEYMLLYQTFPALCGITPDDFISGYTLFVTNLCPDGDMNEVQEKKPIDMRMELRFAEPLKQNVSLIVMAICDEGIVIDKNFQVRRMKGFETAFHGKYKRIPKLTRTNLLQ